ncbi:MAG: excinuclease ABC subunit UvrC [Planctomycetaceae bacterium]|nr:excinuclease ABC subunit UvrC [Planctomycetaceae bacterium]
MADKFTKIREMIKTFPTGPGLYFMKDANGTVLYVGKAANLRSRAGSYFQPAADIESTRGPKIAEMLKKVAEVDFLETQSEVDALLQEARLVKDIRPPYNSDLTDDKSFPYLEITIRDDYPGVYITRQPREKSKLFGPFAGVGDLRAAMVVLQKIFKFRTCGLEIDESDDKRKFFRPCILYSIKQCIAPCADYISKKDYRKNIADLINFLNSKRTTVLRELNQQMEAAAKTMDYEAAAMYRDRIRLIENLDKRGSLDENVQPEVFFTDPTESLEKLQKLLGSANHIRIIEGFDIAHIGGSETVGSLVRFIDGKPFKAGYRRYKIKTVKGVDDYACLKEVLLRRFFHAAAGEELWPDLVLIDGGIGQLHAAEDAFKELKVIPPVLASLAKKEEIIFVSGKNEPLKLPANNPAKKLLQYVRDESHRFAQHYHHILRRKKMLNE